MYSSSVATTVARDDIRIDVTLPITRIGTGPLSFDPLATLIGAPMGDLLAPLRVAEVTRRPSRVGTAVEVHALALPDGEGLSVPLGQFGELGFANRGGFLVLTVPRVVAKWVEHHLSDAIIEGPKIVPSLDGKSMVSRITVVLQKGMRAGIPVGLFGEIGVEAA